MSVARAHWSFFSPVRDGPISRDVSFPSRAAGNMTTQHYQGLPGLTHALGVSWFDNSGDQSQQKEGTHTCYYDSSLLIHSEMSQTQDPLSLTLFCTCCSAAPDPSPAPSSISIVRKICTLHSWSLQFEGWVQEP